MPVFRIGGSAFSAEAFILDKDGTLNNSLAVMPQLVLARAAAVRRRLPEAAGLEEKMALAMGLESGRLHRRSVEVIGSREQTAAAAATVLFLERRVPWDRAMGGILEAFAEVDRNLDPAEKVLPFPGLREWLAEAVRRGFSLAIATNDTVRAVEYFLRHAGLEGLVRHWACADEVSPGKPFPEMAHLAAQRMGVEPERCAVVGDSTWDLEMGRRAGAAVKIGVLSGSGTAEELSPLADALAEQITAIALP